MPAWRLEICSLILLLRHSFFVHIRTFSTICQSLLFLFNPYLLYDSHGDYSPLNTTILVLITRFDT